MSDDLIDSINGYLAFLQDDAWAIQEHDLSRIKAPELGFRGFEQRIWLGCQAPGMRSFSGLGWLANQLGGSPLPDQVWRGFAGFR